MSDIVNITLAEIMTRVVMSLPATATLAEASRIMAEERISSLLIVEDDHPAGIVTESNILQAAHRHLPSDTPLHMIMAQPLISAPETMDVLSARKLVESHRIRHLLVLDEKGRTAGMVSDTDFRIHFGASLFRHIHALENAMERRIPNLPPEATLADGIASMVDHGSDYLVITIDDQPHGIVTGRDIPRLLHHATTPAVTRLASVMTSPVVSIAAHQSVAAALDLMARHRLRHMPVVDRNGRLIGVVCQRRLFEQMAVEQMESALRGVQQERDRLRLEAHLQLALEASGAGGWEYDHGADRFTFSDSLLKLLAFPRSQEPVALATWLDRIHPADRALYLSAFNPQRTSLAQQHCIEYRLRDGEERYRWVEDRGCPVDYGADGAPRLTAGLLTDIDERHRDRQHVSRQNRALRLMSGIAQAMLRPEDEGTLLGDACRTLVDIGGYRAAWITANGYPARVLASAGATAPLPGALHEEREAEFFTPDANAAVEFPLRHTGELLAYLHVQAEHEGDFPNAEIALLDGLADEIALALTSLRTRHALERSEANLTHAQRMARLGHYTYDLLEDRLIRSPIHAEIFGTHETISDLATYLEHIHPSDRPRIEQIFQVDVRQNGLSFDTEYRIQHPTDGVRWVHDSGELSLDRHGRPTRLFGITQDISDRKALERRLQRNQSALREAQEIANLGSWTLDFANQHLEWSEQTQRLLGIPDQASHDFTGFLNQVAPEERLRVLNTWQETLARQGNFDCEHALSLGQQTRWVRLRARIRYTQSGQPAFATGTAQDVTERHLSDEQLSKLSLAIEQSSHSIVITNADAEIEYVNDAFLRTTGYTRDEVIGQNPNRLSSGQTPAETFTALWETLKQGKIWRGEFINQKKNGELYEEFAIISPVRQPDGRITHYLGIKEDITEKKRNQAELQNYREHLEAQVVQRTEQLLHAKEEAESANRAKSAFLANISHEIRTPMNAIIGLTHLVRRDTTDAVQKQRLDKVSDAARHLMSMISDVLDFSKIEAGKLSIENSDFSLAAICNAATVAVGERAEAKGLSIVRDIDPAMPALLHGDSQRIQQILLNFLSNAIKFTERGGIALRARIHAREGNTLKIRCEVADTGIGISPTDIKRLFTPFEQADTSTTRRFGGTGLGLAICRRLAEAMHGEIGVSSEVGKGSTFWFTANVQVPSNSTKPVTSPETTFLPQAPRVLLAEANPITAEIIAEMLRDNGFMLDHAADGASALALARRESYSLALLSLNLPVFDGLAVSQRLRTLPGWLETPVVAMLSPESADPEQSLQQAGINDSLSKPVTPAALHGMLARWLPWHERELAAPPASNVSDQPPSLALIPGLDAEFGLQSVRGRLETYRRLLDKFAQTHGGDFATMRLQLASGNADEARRLAHSLKGAAATLGATAVQQSAQALELAIKEGRDSAATDSLISATEAAYSSLAEHLAAQARTAVAPADTVTSGDLNALLSRLRTALNQGDLSAQELVRQYGPMLQTHLGNRFTAFENKVSAFDFEHALTLLEDASR